MKAQDKKKFNEKLIKDYKTMALQGIPKPCIEIAKKFFKCVEENLSEKDEKGKPYTYEELKDNLETKVIPKCLCKYDLESCMLKEKKEEENIDSDITDKEEKNTEKCDNLKYEGKPLYESINSDDNEEEL